MEIVQDIDRPDAEKTLSQLHAEDILKLVQCLPPAYRMVFTLHVVEAFSHKEIAEKLGISIGITWWASLSGSITICFRKNENRDDLKKQYFPLISFFITFKANCKLIML